MNTNKKWIKRVEQVLEPSLKIPMWENLPEFPFDRLCMALESEFGLKNLKLELKKADWKPGHETLSGFGSSAIAQSIDLTPLASPLFLIFSQEDMHTFISWSLDDHSFIDEHLYKAYFEFALAKILRSVDNEKIYQDLHPKLSSHTLKNEDTYLIDFSLSCSKGSIAFRIACPHKFYQNFNTYCSSQSFSILDTTYGKQIPLKLPLEAGHVSLALNDWKSIKVGDFLLLDHCTYHPREKKGTMSISLNQKPLFHVKLKEGEIRILDYIFYNEGQTMHDDELDDFPEDEFSEEEHFDEHPPEDDFDERSPEEETEDEIRFESNKENFVSPSEVPLTIRAEIGKFQMTLEDLMQLKPGNTIPISTSPEQGVDLTLDGVRIGRGELLQIGDSIGIKINEIK